MHLRAGPHRHQPAGLLLSETLHPERACCGYGCPDPGQSCTCSRSPRSTCSREQGALSNIHIRSVCRLLQTVFENEQSFVKAQVVAGKGKVVPCHSPLHMTRQAFICFQRLVMHAPLTLQALHLTQQKCCLKHSHLLPSFAQQGSRTFQHA